MRRFLIALALVACLGVVACGDDDDGGGGSADGGTSAASDGADVAAAKEMIAPYVGQPNPFPHTEPLEKRPVGAKVAFVDCGSPTCTLIWELTKPAGEAMGIDLYRVKAGQTAQSVTAAFDTVIEQKPDAVIAEAVDPVLWPKQRKALQDAGIPIVSGAIVNGSEYGFVAEQTGTAATTLAGELLAAWVVARHGDKANAAFYNVPEIPFSPAEAKAFVDQMKELCPSCETRVVDIPASAVGSTAPGQIVSDLQANPETKTVVGFSGELTIGLPAALQAAGLEPEVISWGSTPTNLQYVKEGKETAAFAADLPVIAWSFVDAVGRAIAGQEMPEAQREGTMVQQFLLPEEITFDPSKGWVGYPDFAERFTKLWGVE
jgi:ribose transport system substrate-binding protein